MCCRKKNRRQGLIPTDVMVAAQKYEEREQQKEFARDQAIVDRTIQAPNVDERVSGEDPPSYGQAVGQKPVQTTAYAKRVDDRDVNVARHETKNTDVGVYRDDERAYGTASNGFGMGYLSIPLLTEWDDTDEA
jgi:hypothetical protein